MTTATAMSEAEQYLRSLGRKGLEEVANGFDVDLYIDGVKPVRIMKSVEELAKEIAGEDKDRAKDLAKLPIDYLRLLAKQAGIPLSYTSVKSGRGKKGTEKLIFDILYNSVYLNAWS